jgi:hypothetical protein
MTPWVRRLLIANVVMFVATIVSPQLYRLLVLVPADLLVRPWGLVTYMFLHGGFMHLLFNMIGLYFFGIMLCKLMPRRTTPFGEALNGAAISENSPCSKWRPLSHCESSDWAFPRRPLSCPPPSHSPRPQTNPRSVST